MDQTTENYLRTQLKEQQAIRQGLEAKLRASETRELGLIAENNKLIAILRTRGKNGHENQSAVDHP